MSFFTSVKITGNIGGILDAVLGAAKPANVLQVGGNDGTNVYGIPLASGGGSVVVSGSLSSSNITAVTAAVSAANSTTTPLNTGATFTGTSVDLIGTGYNTVQVQLFTDKAGTLQLQFSNDNINWDHAISGTIQASVSESIATGIHGRYYRTVFTNTAGTNQTVMRLQTILVPISVNGTVKDLETPIGINDNAIVTHGIITGVTTGGGGGYVDVKVNPSGALAVAANITGNNGGILDASASQNVAAPASGLLTLGEFNTSPTTISSGNVSPLQLTAAANLKTDISTIAGTAPTTAGFIDIKGADGNVFVRQTTAANLNATVVGTGTFAVQATLSAETTKVIGTVRNLGNAGAIFDAPVSGTAPANALYQGVRGATTYPTAVTDGQMVAPMADKAGRQTVVLNTVRDLVGTAVVSNNSTASGVSFIPAGAAGVFNDIISLIITNRSSTATVVTLTDGTVSYTFAIAGNGGISAPFPTPLPATTSATAWTIGNSATVACDYIAVFAKNK